MLLTTQRLLFVNKGMLSSAQGIKAPGKEVLINQQELNAIKKGMKPYNKRLLIADKEVLIANR